MLGDSSPEFRRCWRDLYASCIQYGCRKLLQIEEVDKTSRAVTPSLTTAASSSDRSRLSEVGNPVRHPSNKVNKK
jgi:hypothetical protein